MTPPAGAAINLDLEAVSRHLFYPRKLSRTSPPAGAVDLEIPVAEGVTLAARFHLAGPADPHVLFFHGNGEVVTDYDDIGSGFVAQAMSFLVVDYRGYGWSGGTPSASTMLRDSHVVLEFVREWLAGQQRAGQLLVMGRSLGSACAIELAAAATPQPAGLIIDSGFAHTLPLLHNLGLDVEELGICEEEGFNNCRKMAAFANPTFILHAQHDQIIPPQDAADLHAASAARYKELRMVPGADHNTIFERTGKLYFEVLRGFVNQVSRPQRRRKMGVRA